MALFQSWRGSLSVVAAIGLLLWHLWADGAVRDNLLALRVIHQIVPPAPTFEGRFPLADVTWVLGFAPWRAQVERDDILMTALEQRAMRNRSAAVLAASYALLTEPLDPLIAERVLALAEANRPLPALWRGRAAWARGGKAEAARHWRVVFGDRSQHRRRFAEGLSVASSVPEEVLLAAEEAVSAMFLPDCDSRCRIDTIEMLRYWTAWPSPSEEAMAELCSGVVGAMQRGERDDVLDGGIANLLARKAVALRSFERVADAEPTLARAEALQRTVYVRAVRAFFLLEDGQPDRAHTEALAVMYQAGSDGHALMMAAHTLEGAGDRVEAKRAWGWTLERVPRLAYVAQGRFDAHRETGRN